MFERFTDRARKCMFLANQEAQRFNHEYIGTEHILLGLCKEGQGVAARVLHNLGIDLRRVRLEVEKLVKSGPDAVVMGKLPQTPRAKKALEFSIEEARGLNHTYVGTEHLLLGLLAENEGVAAQVLMNLGLKIERLRIEVIEIISPESNADKESGSKELDKAAFGPGVFLRTVNDDYNGNYDSAIVIIGHEEMGERKDRFAWSPGNEVFHMTNGILFNTADYTKITAEARQAIVKQLKAAEETWRKKSEIAQGILAELGENTF